VANVCSVLLSGGVGKIRRAAAGRQYLDGRAEYASIQEMKGSLSQKSSPDPAAFERANYMKALKSYV